LIRVGRRIGSSGLDGIAALWEGRRAAGNEYRPRWRPVTEAPKSRWERVQTPLAVVSAVLALVVAVAELPQKIAKAAGWSEDAAAEVELERKRAEVADARARLDVSYVFLSASLLSGMQSDRKQPKRPPAATTLLSFPVVANEVVDVSNPAGGIGRRADRCLDLDYAKVSVAFLVLRNRGKRDAGDVAVEVDRLQLERSVRIRESVVGGDDYVEKLRDASRDTAPGSVRLPQTLAPGDGVLVPVFVSGARYEGAGDWCVVSKTALLPTTLRFTDAATEEPRTAKVRGLNNPAVLDEGVVGRG
jgi:hypothetical protein